MPHSRLRFAVQQLRMLAKLWPAVGIVGARQVGKSTLVREQLGIARALSLDDEDVLDDALSSAKVFLGKLTPPVTIDEVQKAPKLFDALKSIIDRKRIPGQFFLTGSTEFSARLGIRESLTGRIGLLRLFPMTLAEAHQKSFVPPELKLHSPRFRIDEFAAGMVRGGLPMPLFLRDSEARRLYWQGWLDTTVYRDLPRFFPRTYDPRLSLRILSAAVRKAREGALLQASDVSGVQLRTLQRYLTAMEDSFLLTRVSCHESGVGKDLWAVFDSGLLHFLADGDASPHEQLTLSIARQYLRNELLAGFEYTGRRRMLEYYKSARGGVIDFVFDEVPIKVVGASAVSRLGWEERAVQGAMKTLKSPLGILAAPIERVEWPKNGKGIAIVPWTFWS